MLVYRLYKSTYIRDPLSAEGARRAGGRWNPKGIPILYTSATPELALLEIIAHLNPMQSLKNYLDRTSRIINEDFAFTLSAYLSRLAQMISHRHSLELL